MNALSLNKKIMNAFDNHDLLLLEQLFSSYPAHSIAEKRFLAHCRGKKDLISGELEKSFQQLKMAFNNYGPHVGLLSDLVSVAYLLNDVREMRIFSLQMEKELLVSKTKLTSDSLVKSLIFLGKIKELDGEVYQALECYREAFDHAKDSDLYLKAAAQLIRLNSFLGKQREIVELYNLINFKKMTWNDFDFELNHASLLLELRIFGMSPFNDKLNRILDSALPNYDKKQMVCHYLEELLWINEKPQPETIKKIKNIISFDELNSLESLVVSQFMDTALDVQSTCPSKLDELKKLILLIKICNDSKERDVYKKMFFFHIQNLSKESRMLIEKKWMDYLGNSETVIKLSLSKKSISYDEKSVGNEKSKQLFSLLLHFEKCEAVSSELIATELFELNNYGESEYHRLRMAISRLNKVVRESTGIAKLFSLKFDELKISANIRIEIID